jgi:hypothetical protein
MIEGSVVDQSTDGVQARGNRNWASARVTPTEAVLVIAGLVSVNILWIMGFDVDLAIVKCGSAVTALTLAITVPYRVLDIVRLRILRDVLQSPDAARFL